MDKLQFTNYCAVSFFEDIQAELVTEDEINLIEKFISTQFDNLPSLKPLLKKFLKNFPQTTKPL